jgi:hypothetical protein
MEVFPLETALSVTAWIVIIGIVILVVYLVRRKRGQPKICHRCGRKLGFLDTGESHCFYCNTPNAFPVNTDPQTAQTLSAEFVGFWPRVLAYIIDVGLCALCALPGLFGPPTFMAAWIVGVIFLAFPVYQVVAVWRFSGTIGHHLINAKVVGIDPRVPYVKYRFGKPNLRAASVREAIKLLLGYSVIGLPVFLFVATDHQGQGIHDELASTFVIKK